MKFSDTTNKDGLIQDCEQWCNLGDGGISGDSVLLKQFTGRLNHAFDEVLPIVFQSDAKWQYDDPNHTDHPIATLDLASGQPDYSFISDEDGNSILELRSIFVKDPQGIWQKLTPIDADSDPNTSQVFAQNSTNTGTPTRYDKIGTTIWLDPMPNYSSTGGVRGVFSRSQSYFVSGDTTKTPGIPSPFHRLLPLIASRDYVAVHKTDNPQLLNTINGVIAELKRNLATHFSKRSRDEKPVLRVRTESSR